MRTSDRQGDLPAVLAEFADRAAAQRLATRLVAERVGAEVWDPARAATVLPGAEPPLGPTVMVRQEDHRHALMLARLYAEVDAGTSRIAPPPRDFWHGAAHQRLGGYGLVAVLVLAVVILLITAATM